ncbi:MAG: hypothetical protein AB7I50_06705 [Vicinamibacterales bacterium]
MKSCKDVSYQLSTGDVAHAPLLERVGVWLHLAMCRNCRAFSRQLSAMARAARGAASTTEAEPRESFEREIVERLRQR